MQNVLTFLFLPRFYVFNFFWKLTFNVFIVRNALEIPPQKIEKHFWNYRNELIGHSDGGLLSPNILDTVF